MGDAEPREQHNHGPGTFVGGNVNGRVVNIFLLLVGKKHAGSDRPPHERDPEQDDEGADDYENIGVPLLTAGLLGSWTGWLTIRELMGWSWSDGSSPPGIAERIVGGLLLLYVSLACLAAFFARSAQVCELGSKQCAATATQSRGRLVAWPPALMARGLSLVSAATASLAEVLASLYGWRPFGGQVSRRARIARLNAATNAKTAAGALTRSRRGP